MAFCACECVSLFPTPSVHVNPQSHLEGVSACPVGCIRVTADLTFSSSFSRACKYCTIYGAGIPEGSAAMLPYSFAETCMEIR